MAPHNDDETLFGAFTLLRHRPHVVVVYRPDDPVREAETAAAMEILGCTWEQADFELDTPEDSLLYWLDETWPRDTKVFAPRFERDGQPQHNRIAAVAPDVFPSVTHYLTYSRHGKAVNGTGVPYEFPWIGLKLRALACYKSQFAHPSHAPHFMRGLDEYYA